MRACKYHCRSCGGHFTSLRAFDAHRAGPYDGERTCAYPDDAGLVEIPGGMCKISDPDQPQIGVTLYEHEAAGELRDYRRGLEACGRAEREPKSAVAA